MARVVCAQDLLTKHKMMAAEFLDANYDKVFAHYQRLLNSDNYVTRRQALKVLRTVAYPGCPGIQAVKRM